jgi:alkanesulfonate monooxygenase SsuD/methylene tetrahydromethanopterin reductase-like flavin-dependent oxidoreductase (luciferase family)
MLGSAAARVPGQVPSIVHEGLPMRFGVLNFSDGRPYRLLAERWQRFEALGFDSAWIADDMLVARYADFDPWVLLAGLARDTRRIRIGTLISTVRLRHPTFLAAEALTLDHVSNGRAALGIGAGEPEQNATIGNPPWSARETLERLAEQAEILHDLLRGRAVARSAGYYPTVVPPMATPITRPPLVVAAHGPIGLRAAARHADVWNCLGGQRYSGGPNPDRAEGRRSLAECVAETERLLALLDDACTEAGRDPATLARSMLAFYPALDPFASVDAFDEYAGAYAHLGLEEMVLYWPPLSSLSVELPSAADEARFERIAAERILARVKPADGEA